MKRSAWVGAGQIGAESPPPALEFVAASAADGHFPSAATEDG